MAGSEVLPNYDGAPFVELHNGRVNCFKSLGNTVTVGKKNTENGF